VTERHDPGDPTGANNVSSTPEGKQEEATAHAEGKESDQAAEKARE
jgi:hypothetical protein